MNPINEDTTKEKSIQALTENLESGFISQEEYDRTIEMMDIYSTIVE